MKLSIARSVCTLLTALVVPTLGLSQASARAPESPKPKHCSIEWNSPDQPTPRYPEALKGSGIEGVVGLRVVIGENGCTEGVTVAKKLQPQLDKIAKEFVESRKFKPAMKDGKPVRVLVAMEVKFKE